MSNTTRAPHRDDVTREAVQVCLVGAIHCKGRPVRVCETTTLRAVWKAGHSAKFHTPLVCDFRNGLRLQDEPVPSRLGPVQGADDVSLEHEDLLSTVTGVQYPPDLELSVIITRSLRAAQVLKEVRSSASKSTTPSGGCGWSCCGARGNKSCQRRFRFTLTVALGVWGSSESSSIVESVSVSRVSRAVQPMPEGRTLRFELPVERPQEGRGRGRLVRWPRLDRTE